MFERFTEKATRAIIIAQEESRRLGHNFVGTEQILLGLIGEETGVAAKVLNSLGVTLEATRSEVEKFIGRGSGEMHIEIPFTPRAKAALMMALTESSELGQSYIGTEHLLLGIVREGERIVDMGMGRGPSTSLAFRVLQNLGVEQSNIRTQVIQMLGRLVDRSSEWERLSMQSYRERLGELLPQMSSQALRVWHALGSQIGWEETIVEITITRIMRITNLNAPEVQAALDELLNLGVITRIEPS